MKRRMLKLCAVILAFVLVAGTSGVEVFGNSLGHLRNERQRLAGNVSQIRSQLNAVQAQRNSVEFELMRLDIAIEEAIHTYQFLTDLLAWAYRELEIVESRLQLAREEYGRQSELFGARIRYLNESNTFGLGYLELFLSSTSIVDAMNNADTINRLAEHDQNLIMQFQQSRDFLAEVLDEVDDFRVEMEALRIQQEIYMHEIEERQLEKEATLAILAEQQAFLEEMMQGYERESRQVYELIQNAEAEARRAQNVAMTQFVGGSFAWPVPGFSHVSSNFGPRVHPITRRNHVHTGIDIAGRNNAGRGINGADIVAAADGRVIHTGRMGGYGLTVIIDHGGGMSTLYAHASAILVQVGQQVRRHDVIARVGSTGTATGPHLHFEIRVNGTPQNPMDWFR